MSREDKTQGVQAVHKAFEALELVAEHPALTTPSFISERLGLSLHRTTRMLDTLENKGLLEFDHQSGGFLLGPQSIELARKLLDSIHVLKHARPVMQNLEHTHEEAVYMTIMRGNDVLFVDVVDSEQTGQTSSLVGKKFPFFSNAAGKVMAAFESRDIVDKYFKKNRRLKQIVNTEILEVELDQIRSCGVAVETGGLGEGITSVAVAVKDYAGKVIGALTMLGPSIRLLGERLETEIIPSMVGEALLLSQKFGYAN